MGNSRSDTDLKETKRIDLGSAQVRSHGVEFDLLVLVIGGYRCQSEGFMIVCLLGSTNFSSNHRIEKLTAIFLLVGEKVHWLPA